MMNTTQIITSPPSPVGGLIAFSVASILLIVCLGILLFLRHTTCFTRCKFVALWLYSKCCCCLPSYSQHIENEAREIRGLELESDFAIIQ